MVDSVVGDLVAEDSTEEGLLDLQVVIWAEASVAPCKGSMLFRNPVLDDSRVSRGSRWAKSNGSE